MDWQCAKIKKSGEITFIQGFKDSKINIGGRAGVAERSRDQPTNWIQRFKNSKIQRFNSAEAGIGFKKYSVAFCVSVFSRRQNIRALVA